ncbi:MAG: 4-alpha-glucanotransferase, partial [Clostridia bacterium]|nr:4-alpha-glucanotransferase [Clostridia bacterium]
MLLRVRNRKNLKSGILLALSSLPSPYGIGSLGKEAFDFIDFLKKSRQSYWQLLPLCPVGKGNSPYSSYSSFAGEILYIDIDSLVEDGYLQKEDIPQMEFPKNTDYDAVRSFKLPLLQKAAENFDKSNKDFLSFKIKNQSWLNDFSIFMAICDDRGTRDFTKWNEELKYRKSYALDSFCKEHKKSIDFYLITQFF